MMRTSSVSQLKGVGPTLERRLLSLGIRTIEDLLHHFPFRYEDYSSLLPIAEVPDDVPVTIKGKIELIANKRSPRKNAIITEAIIADNTSKMRVVWFGQPFLSKQLEAGDTVYLSGKISNDRFGRQMLSPTHEKEKKDGSAGARILPMYPLTAGLTQKQLRNVLAQVTEVIDQVEDWVPEEVQERQELLPIKKAMKLIHFPSSMKDVAEAQKRIKFDEVFVLQVRAQMIRAQMKSAGAAQIPFSAEDTKAFIATLPFTLTADQKRSAWELFQDMEQSQPMNRLLEGDVGSGKTVVAAMTIDAAIRAGKQTVLMAPTEILATQHFASMKEYLPNARVGLLTSSKVELSTGSLDTKTKKSTKESFLKLLKDGEIDLVVGTHAVISDGVAFADLAYAVVDEQHRFGVAQRKKIKDLSGNDATMPHFLSMTATPIPRSFALTLHGDLDISMMKQMPKGRKPVATQMVAPHNRDDAYRHIRQEIQNGHQAFVICPRIEQEKDADERDALQKGSVIERGSDKKSVMSEYERLSNVVFPDLTVGYVHGKMRPKEKDAVMKDFADGKIAILVSTSVVEVGVDIPNATVMIIEGAESFGLAQLHQFRGRVGRSEHQSYCYAFLQYDSEKAVERLGYFAGTTDGFALAEFDLQMRGPGEVYGTSQSGMGQFRLATMMDVDLIKAAAEEAKIIDVDAYPALKKRVEDWERNVHLE
ncbi:MAG: ATP-dependent DNA helicase RecG [Candidatus Magasanikbacteria bacterium]|jgi:ATP-dependent DNA helicase RecG|nr:ATP-dependent DNA helicase RecG [Candidatus Magasanikbacteria bacterium]